MKANSPGRPTELTPAVHKRLVEAVPHVIIPAQVAALARVPKQTLSDWLSRGEKDARNGVDSIYAQFSDEYLHTQAKVVKETLTRLKACPKIYQPLIWILERCFRRDFGADADEIKELIRNLEIIMNAKKGGLDNGEADSQSTE